MNKRQIIEITCKCKSPKKGAFMEELKTFQPKTTLHVPTTLALSTTSSLSKTTQTITLT